MTNKKRPLCYTIRQNAGRDDVTIRSEGGEITFDRSTMSKDELNKLTFQLTKAFREVYCT